MARRRVSAGDAEKDGENGNTDGGKVVEQDALTRTYSESVVGRRLRRLSLGGLVFRSSPDGRPPISGGGENGISKKARGDYRKFSNNVEQTEISATGKQMGDGLRRHKSESGVGGRLGGIRLGNPSDLIAAARTSVREKALKLTQNFKKPQAEEVPSVTRPDGSIECAPLRFREVETQRRTLMKPLGGRHVATTTLGWDNPAYGLDDGSDVGICNFLDSQPQGAAVEEPDEYLPSIVALRTLQEAIQRAREESAPPPVTEPAKEGAGARLLVEERAMSPEGSAQLATPPVAAERKVTTDFVTAMTQESAVDASTGPAISAGTGLGPMASAMTAETSAASDAGDAGNGHEVVVADGLLEEQGDAGVSELLGGAKEPAADDRRRGLRSWLAKRGRRKSGNAPKGAKEAAGGDGTPEVTEASDGLPPQKRDGPNKAAKQSPTESPRKHALHRNSILQTGVPMQVSEP